MGMPKELVFVRHGMSEANDVQNCHKIGKTHPREKEILARPDWQQRLSVKGIEQAKNAGEWLERELGGVATFDLRYASQFVRARETAIHMGGVGSEDWILDDRIVERNWGIFGTASREDQKNLFPMTADHKEINPWYVGLDGGESLSSGVLLRSRDFFGTLHREAHDKKVLVVTHGEFMWVARYILERMMPEEWEALDNDSSQRIRNCSALHYSKVNPEDPEDVRKHLKWVRVVYTDGYKESPNNGEWQLIPERKIKSRDEIIKQVSQFPPLTQN